MPAHRIDHVRKIDWDEACIPEPNSGCLIWLGGATGDGYGRTFKPYKSAHRAAFEDAYGPIPNGMFVCHRCDVRLCCNPNHLFLGTHSDNMIDREKKRRGNHAHGSNHCCSVLTEEQAREIFLSSERYAHLAKRFRVGWTAIYQIKHKRTWKHIHGSIAS